MARPPGRAVPNRRRNLYVRDEDRTVWERAEELAGEPISVVVTNLLRRYVAQREAAAQDRVVVPIADEQRSNIFRKGFKGRYLVIAFRSAVQAQNYATTHYWAAQGAGGGLALWITDGGTVATRFETYSSFEQAVEGQLGWPADFLSAVSGALGEEYVEEIDL